MTQCGTDTPFAVNGVIGIVDNSIRQIDLALESGLSSIEIRADLLRSAGLGDDELRSLVSAGKSAGLRCLYTLRHADQGGTFDQTEQERVTLCSQAVEAGADIIDLEHGTAAATEMLRLAAPMILSYHNFTSMLSHDELFKLTIAMEQQSPAAIKIIPTGQNIVDAATMLEWVSAAGPEIRRIGFTMGAAGAASRILGLSVGAPVTYASFGDPVAPGQVALSRLLNNYHCMHMNRHTKIVALTGSENNIDQYSAEHSEAMADEKTICIGFPGIRAELVEQYQQPMNISEIISV